MTDDPYNLSRFDDLKPGLDFVVLDPDAESGLRAMTPAESAGLRDAFRTPSERADRADEQAAQYRRDEAEFGPPRGEGAVEDRALETAHRDPAESDADSDEQGWRDRLGLDEPNRIQQALEPDISVRAQVRDDEELER